MLTWLYGRNPAWDGPYDLITDPNGILDLPQGFSYHTLERSGDPMTDGHRMPPLPDGMGCFSAPDGSWILMRNHEIHAGSPADPSFAYDGERGGGVSRVIVDPDTGQRLASNMVLTGTSRNCAGGITPRGWLSCEETDEPDHGYVFLCDTEAQTLQKPRPIPTLGRFPHEAAAFDPDSGITYLTEDVPSGAIYRNVPEFPDRPFIGRLEALKLKGDPSADLSTGRTVHDRFSIDWVAIDDPDAKTMATRQQAQKKGAAVFSRGEGIWFDNRQVFIVSTDGGPAGSGQIYRLDIAPAGEADQLTLIAQAEDDASLRNPDNITVAPWGDVFIADDSSAPNLIRILKPEGSILKFARNAEHGGSSEFAGLCFSPDSRWLFVNVQKEGRTLAITGPFSR